MSQTRRLAAVLAADVADEDEPHATPEGAAQAVEFANALASILFVLPSRVTRGLKEAGGTPVAEGGKLPS